MATLTTQDKAVRHQVSVLYDALKAARMKTDPMALEIKGSTLETPYKTLMSSVIKSIDQLLRDVDKFGNRYLK